MPNERFRHIDSLGLTITEVAQSLTVTPITSGSTASQTSRPHTVVGDETLRPATIVLNWAADLKR